MVDHNMSYIYTHNTTIPGIARNAVINFNFNEIMRKSRKILN